MNMPDKSKKRNVYNEEFKRDTVQKYAISGIPVSLFAHHIGIEQSILHRWVKKYNHLVNKSTISEQGRKQSQIDEIEEIKNEIASIRRSVEMLRKIVEKSFLNRYRVGNTGEKKQVNGTTE